MRDKRRPGFRAQTKGGGAPVLGRITLVFLFLACFSLSDSSSAGRLGWSLQEEREAVEFDFVPASDERSYARRIASEIEKETDILKDEPLDDYLKIIGRRIIERNNLRELIGDWDWSFRIIDSSDVNAFAALGGHVYLSRGLIEAVESESELAAILSFEFGHIIARHVHQHINERLARQTDFSPEEKLTGDQGWETLSGLFVSEGGVYMFFSNLRHNSLQVEKADELALLNNYNAEFNPQAFLTLLNRLGRRERPLPRWLRRNPWNQRRSRKISSSIRLLPSLTSPLTHTRFREFKTRLESLMQPSSRGATRQPVSDQELLLDVTVMGDRDWTDTGIEVHEGQEISFSAFGTVYLQEGNIKVYCGPDGYDLKTRQQPFADRNIGALVGKVSILLSIEFDEGSGREIRHEIREKFFIGSDNEVRMPISGQLFLGINENLVGDNTGAFSVSIVYFPIRFFPFP